MLLTKILNVKANSTTYKYYNSLGYNCRIGDIIEIKVEDLKPTSGETVLVKCDYCGKEYELKYRDYNKVNDINKTGGRRWKTWTRPAC